MNVSIEVKPSIEALLARLGRDMAAGIRVGVAHVRIELEAAAVEEAPVQTGNLANAITSYETDGGMGGVIKVTDAAPYSLYVHRGTGIFGPHKTPIVPTEKKALFWPGARHPVRSVKGQRPNPFFKRAVANTDTSLAFEQGVGVFLNRRGW